MTQWVKVEKVEDFSGHVKVIEHDGKLIAIYKLPDGYYAIDDVCSHEEASLSEGELENGKIECPMHGARFDIRTGKNLNLPAVLPVKSYPVKLEDGEILIQVDN